MRVELSVLPVLAFLWAVSPFLMAKEPPHQAYRISQEGRYVVVQDGNCAFIPEGATVMSHGSPGWVDAWQDTEGRITLVAHQRVWRSNRKGSGWSEDMALSAQAPSGWSPVLETKFREGALWRQTYSRGNLIERFDSRRKAWVSVLVAPDRFADFEVLPGGDVLLIGTPKALAQVHAPGSREPLRVFPYPELEVPKEALKEIDWWERIRTYGSEGRVLIYAPRPGLLMLLDAITGTFRTLDPPWKAMDPEQFRKRCQANPPKQVLNLSDLPGAGCFQFIPLRPGQVGLAWFLRPYALEKISFRPDGIPTVLPRKIYPEDASGAVHTAILDLETGTLRQERTHSDLAYPVWMFSEDQVVPLTDLLQGLKLQAVPAPKPPESEPR